jgi:hypothetical protein
VDAILRMTLRPADRESVPGDLLEEYRAARRPTYGALRADAWYVWQVTTILWQLIRPFALGLATLTILVAMLNGLAPWYGSPVPAPAISVVHALIYIAAGYHASRRTRLIASGILAAGSVSVIGFKAFIAAAVITMPRLIGAAFTEPFILVIFSVMLSIALLVAVVCGAVGGAIGRAVSPASAPEAKSS